MCFSFFFGLFVTIIFENAIYFSFHEILMIFSPLYNCLSLGIAPSPCVPGSLGTQRVVQPVIITLFLSLSPGLLVHSRECGLSHSALLYVFSLADHEGLIASCYCLFCVLCMLFLYACWRQPGENQVAIDKMGEKMPIKFHTGT